VSTWETKLCALPTCSAEEEKWGKGKMNVREKERIEKDFIFLPFLFIYYLLLFFPFRRLRRYIVFSPFHFGTAHRRLRRVGYSSLSICEYLIFHISLFIYSCGT
jgi:hypothetical protein